MNLPKKLNFITNKSAFTLIELLVVISIIGTIMGISLAALQGARAAGRDSKRKADLEQIRSALEIYRSDCQRYPESVPFGQALIKEDCIVTIPSNSSNTYLSLVPQDQLSPSRAYYYKRTSPTAYDLCASLEAGGTTNVCSNGICGEGKICNYKVNNP